MKKNNISYRIFDEKSYIDLVLYNPKKFNIDELDKSKVKKFGQQLGDFYTCATNDVSKNHYRVVISANKLDSNNVVEIFAQMCIIFLIVTTEICYIIYYVHSTYHNTSHTTHHNT